MVKKTNTKEEKLESLGDTVALLNARFKKNVVQFGYAKVRERIPFRSEKMNEITGGGVPAGLFSVIWGPKGSTKTTDCYELVANAQKMNKRCYWIDLERSFDPVWAKINGVNVDDLIYGGSFATAEEALDTVLFLTRNNSIDLIILDSIQGLSPEGENYSKKGKEQSLKDDTMALIAKKLSQFFRMSASGVATSNCTMVMIGQTRKDIGGYITLDKLSGGNALEHWSSLTIKLRRGQKSDFPAISTKTGNPVKASNENAEIIGLDIVALVEKSKVGPDEGKSCHVKFISGKGNCDWDG